MLTELAIEANSNSLSNLPAVVKHPCFEKAYLLDKKIFKNFDTTEKVSFLTRTTLAGIVTFVQRETQTDFNNALNIAFFTMINGYKEPKR